MSSAAVSGVSIFQELQNFYQTRQSDLKQLGTALQNGDLNGAQQTFSALQQLGQSGPFSSSEPFSKNIRAQAFEAIGQALQSGDLAGAQSAFAALTSGSAQSSPAPSPATIVNFSGTHRLPRRQRQITPRPRPPPPLSTSNCRPTSSSGAVISLNWGRRYSRATAREHRLHLTRFSA